MVELIITALALCPVLAAAIVLNAILPWDK